MGKMGQEDGDKDKEKDWLPINMSQENQDKDWLPVKTSQENRDKDWLPVNLSLIHI